MAETPEKDDSRSSIRSFCFTLNNYTEEEYKAAREYASGAVYAVIGREVGKEGTPHLQGYVLLKSPTKFGTVKKKFPRAHIEKAKGTPDQNKTYCTKDKQFDEFGAIPEKKSGKRSDLESFKDAARAGRTYDQLMETHSEVCARYSRFAKEYVAKVARDNAPKTEIAVYREWQKELMEMISQPPHPRRIDWVVDEEGGKGKTFLAKHLVSKHGAFYTTGGKSNDIFYAYQGQRIAIFDFVRESRDFVNYGAIEAIKNGILSSNKYESTMKTFPIPHVIVFANFTPAPGKLSRDRINLFLI